MAKKIFDNISINWDVPILIPLASGSSPTAAGLATYAQPAAPPAK